MSTTLQLETDELRRQAWERAQAAPPLSPTRILWHRAQADNLRRMAAAEDRYRQNYGWQLNQDQVEQSQDLAADLRRQAANHEAKAVR